MKHRIGIFVIALIAIVGIFYFGSRHAHSQTVKNLRKVRGAIFIFHGANAERYPKHLDELKGAVQYKDQTTYLVGDIPPVRMFLGRPHKDNQSSVYYGSTSNDAGGWRYNNVPGTRDYGIFVVNCTHNSFFGQPWEKY